VDVFKMEEDTLMFFLGIVSGVLVGYVLGRYLSSIICASVGYIFPCYFLIHFIIIMLVLFVSWVGLNWGVKEY